MQHTYKSQYFKIKNKWYQTITTYVDIETGEIISKSKATDKHQYITVKTEKHETTKDHGNNIYTIHITKQCRKQPQTKLFN